MDPRFRPTLWPGTIIPVPALRTRPDTEVDGDWLVWGRGGKGPSAQVNLPPDFYLRELMALPSDDLEAAAHMMRTYGILFDFEQADLDTESMDDLNIPLEPPLAYDSKYLIGGFHKDDVQLHIETAHSAIEAWIALQAPGKLEEVIDSKTTERDVSEFWARQQEKWFPASMHTRQNYINAAAELYISELEGTLNSALGGISAGIIPQQSGSHHVTVYSASFLQLYNHMAERATLRRCANEPCNKNFVRQRGRAQFDQHHTQGIKYCSRECARAQAQRELRRRRKTTQ